MKQKSVVQYFRDGFFLANKSLDIFFVAVVIALIYFILYFTRASSAIMQFVPFFLVFIAWGYGMLIPLFLVDKQQNKSFDLNYVLSVILRNTKRFILPIILYIIFSFISIVFFAFLMLAPYEGDSDIHNFIQKISGALPNPHLMSLVFIGLFSFFVFTPIYFSIENKGIISSIKRSLIISLKNLSFIVLVVLFNFLSYSITTLIPIEGIWGQIFRTIIGSYISFIITASSLLYYQNAIKKSFNLI